MAVVRRSIVASKLRALAYSTTSRFVARSIAPLLSGCSNDVHWSADREIRDSLQAGFGVVQRAAEAIGPRAAPDRMAPSRHARTRRAPPLSPVRGRRFIRRRTWEVSMALPHRALGTGGLS